MKHLLSITLIISSVFAFAQTSQDELAKQLANPIASLTSVPLQNNFDFNVGANNGFKYTLNAQPVAPFSIGKKWNLISRTIVPIVHQQDVIALGSTQNGMSDIVQSFFFSPKEATKGGLIWGVGPVFLFPTATDPLIGTEKWGAGPTIVALKVKGKLTYGVLANHIVSFAGTETRNNINASFFQPFFTKGFSKGVTVTIASENTANWESSTLNGLVGIYGNKVTKVGKQMLQLGVGPKLNYDNHGNYGFGVRANLIFLFPKKKKEAHKE